jgi:hypothetical protein
MFTSLKHSGKIGLTANLAQSFQVKPQKGNITTLPQRKGNITTLPQKHSSFIRFGRADTAQAIPKKTTLSSNWATVRAVFVCIFKTRNNVKYVNQLVQENEIFKNKLF